MLTAPQVIDRYYLETRCMLIEIAAMLDRYDRGQQEPTNGQAPTDPRLELIRQSLTLLADKNAGANRSEQLLMLFTDQTN